MTVLNRALAISAAMLVVGCTDRQQENIDSATGALATDAQQVATDARAELSVLDIDIGKRVGTSHEVDDEIDTFAPKDTIYASVNTTGTVRPGAITSRWIFPDGSTLEAQARPPVADRDANLLFFLTKPEGLPTGKYTFRVFVDGREVRSQEATVR